MKTIKMKTIAAAASLLFLSGLVWSGCSDDFLKEMGFYDGGGWDIFDDFGLAQGRVNYLYQFSLPETNAGRDLTKVSTGLHTDINAQMTWEYGGSPSWGDAAAGLTIKNAPQWFGTSKATEGPYMIIRNANVTLYGLENSKLGEEGTRTLRGETYFWRAWNYMLLFQYYGGVPIIDELQDPILSTNDGADLRVNRSTTRDTCEFLMADLDRAVELLPDRWPSTETGRITRAAAAALRARMALLWASPLFNRADDPQRWDEAYASCLEAYNLAVATGHELVRSTAAENAKQWEQMFLYYDSPEAVMVTLYNSVNDKDLSKLNGWENGCRPSTNVVFGGGTRPVPAEMIDLWPMADGKTPGESAFEYDELAFFKDRDPRFYRTFAFPGAIWPFQGNSDFTTWHYVWYDTQENMDNPRNTGWCGNYASTPSSAAIVRKRTSPTASYNNSDFFKYSNLPYAEIRMAEVVLNLAEAAAGANKPEEAYTHLRSIRARAYGADSPYAASDYGLPADIKSDRGKLIGAILYERQIELAYEGKRFEDMRRWLLLDGGTDVTPAYKNGNTYAYLGYSDPSKVSPVGLRHHGIQIMYPEVLPGANAAIELNDPFAGNRPKGLDPDSPTFRQDMETLADFYGNFVRKTTDNLDNADERLIFWSPNYYFLGLRENNLTTMPYLWQTQGWPDYYGNPGLFDIFSDELPAKPQVPETEE